MTAVKRMKSSHGEQKDMRSSPSSNMNDDMKNIQDLPSDVFQHCLEFVGKGNFAFVAPVSKHFYWNYINLGVEIKNNIVDVEVILQQGRNKKTTVKDVVKGSLRLATECFLKASAEFQEQVCRQAAVNGRLDILKCAVAFRIDMKKTVFPYRNADGSQITCWNYVNQLADTVANGHLDVIEFVHDQGINLDCKGIVEEIGKRGKAEYLHWMASKGIISDHLRHQIFNCLVRDGELDILKENYKNSFRPMRYSTFESCAEGGNIEVMTWLLQENDGKCSSDIFPAAAKSGSIPMMELCLQNGCQPREYICECAMENKDHEAALDALKWLRENNCPWDYRVCEFAAMYGNLKALKFARENGCPWNMYTFEWAAQYGHIHILDYCVENNCPVKYDKIFYNPFEDEPFSNERQEISLKVYKWLRQHSVPWIDDGGLVAAQEGHWNTFMWAIENGCPWHGDVLGCAIEQCNVQMVEYCLNHLSSKDDTVYVLALNKMNQAEKNVTDKEMITMLLKIHDCGIPWSRDIIPCAERLRRSNVASWLRCVGCPR